MHNQHGISSRGVGVTSKAKEIIIEMDTRDLKPCYHCDEDINRDAIFISMSGHQKAQGNAEFMLVLGRLLFHKECFEEMAGKKFVSTMFEQVDVDGLTETERELLRGGKKIQAIKEVRQRTGLGLKEAKDLADAFTGSGTIP